MNKEVLLYDGNVKVQFNNQARNRYMVTVGSGEPHSPVGVTTVLSSLAKPALMLWPMNEALAHLKINVGDYEGAAKAYLKKSDKGKDTGTAMHSAVEEYLTTGNIIRTYMPEIDKGLKSFIEWVGEVKPKKLATEQIVYSIANGYAGTYDGLLEIDGKVVLMDIKTTNSSRSAPLGIYPEMFLQLGAYSAAHHEENPLEKIDELMVIRVGKDGVVNTLTANEVGLTIKQCEDTFLDLLKVYRLMTPLAKQLTERKA